MVIKYSVEELKGISFIIYSIDLSLRYNNLVPIWSCLCCVDYLIIDMNFFFIFLKWFLKLLSVFLYEILLKWFLKLLLIWFFLVVREFLEWFRAGFLNNFSIHCWVVPSSVFLSWVLNCFSGPCRHNFVHFLLQLSKYFFK